MKTSSSRPAFLLIALGMVASCGILVKAKSDPENRDLVTTNTSSKDAEPSGESSEPPPAQNAPDGRSDYSLCKAINDADHSLPTASGNSKFAHDPKTDYIFNPTFSAMSDLFAQGKLIDANLAGRITKLISATYDYFELQPLWNPGNLYLPGKGRYPWLTMFPADAAEIQGWIRPTPNVSLLKTLERTIYLAGGDLDLRAAGTIKDCIIVAKGNVIATRAEFCTIIAGGNISIGTSVSSVGVSSGVIKTELMDNEGHPSNFARGFYISSESKISFQVPENAERFTVQSNGGVFERISTIAFSPYSTRYDVPEAIALRKQYVIEYTAEGHGSSRRINERYPNELRIRYEYRPVDLSQSEDFRISFPDSSIIEFGASNMTIKRYDRNSTEISVHNIQHHKNLVSHLQYDSGVSWISTFARLDRKEVEDDKQLGDQVKLLFDDTHDSCQAAIEHNSDELFLKGKCGGKILNYHAKISDWKVAGKVRAFYQLFKKTKGVVTSCSNVNNEIFQFLNVKPQNGGG
ncbi:MAG: hypothetical protein NTV34_09620, partial [Proteobacteria bacterium]|nr:hypothetical protein [Pseudomonadota bacterium]